MDFEFLARLRCPDCSIGCLYSGNEMLVCRHCGANFPFSERRPILLRHDNALFDIDGYRISGASQKTKLLGQYIPSPSINVAKSRVLRLFRQRLDARGVSNILVVGSGCQRRWLDSLLLANRPHRIVYSDIDIGADVDLFCDGHDLPFIDSSFDAVVTTAVLEHVLYPERVVSEITRVLKLGSLLYSELPFMQQVHEGAYDFTRYTLSGHRRLFNQFSEIEAGMVAGPATSFVWALENLLLAFVSNITVRKLAKAFVRLFFGWIKHLDWWLVKRVEAMDAASCTFFFGSKVVQTISDGEIISRYVGAKNIKHI